jgi:hypothetical protein
MLLVKAKQAGRQHLATSLPSLGAMELSPSPESPSKGRIHALFTRIHLLEQHALTVQAAFRAEAMKADARDVIAALYRAEAWLAAAPDVVAEVETLVEAACRQLSCLGRASSSGSLATRSALLSELPDARPAAGVVATLPVCAVPLVLLQQSPVAGAPARRVGDRLFAGAAVPRRLRDRRAPVSATRVSAVLGRP